MIRASEVITILDAGGRKSPTTLAPFLNETGNQGRLERISDLEEVKSFVVTRTIVYASPISSLTLMKRADLEGNRAMGETINGDPEKKEDKE